MEEKHWILGVLEDLSAFTTENQMPELTAMLAKNRQVAESEVNNQNRSGLLVTAFAVVDGKSWPVRH